MKIIGKRENGYIIDIPDYELTKLIGYYKSQKSTYVIDKDIREGTIVEINKMFDQLYELQDVSERYKRAIKTMKDAVELLTPLCPIFNEVVKTKEEIKGAE